MKSLKSCLATALVAAVLAVTSCAVSESEDSHIATDRYLKSWMKVNYPDIKASGSYGVYRIEYEQGTGASVTDSSYVFVHYVKKDMNGNIASTNLINLSKQIGSYASNYYYGSDIWRVDQGYLPVGIEEVIKTMKIGGHAKLAVPISASTLTNATYNTFSNTTEDNNYIFEFEIDSVVTDIYAHQDKQLRNFSNEHMGGVDTLREHLYLKKLIERTSDEDTITEGNTAYVQYIGRLLDGTVFDTNIEDTAKKYRIWNSSSSYDNLSIVYYKNDLEKFNDENSVVKGFGYAVIGMNKGETAITVFRSDLGYGESGSNMTIPEYAPLYFWLHVVNPEEE